MTANEIPRRIRQPADPSGIPFKEWEISLRFPRLAAKYGYKDSNWMYLKEREEKDSKKQQVTEQVVNVLLKSGIIPTCGLIPPLRVLEQVLRTGHAPESTGCLHTWPPIELEEEHYWSAVVRLEKMSPQERISRANLQTANLKQDLGASNIERFDDWIETLQQRGLV
jgi:hypothetical protein